MLFPAVPSHISSTCHALLNPRLAINTITTRYYLSRTLALPPALPLTYQVRKSQTLPVSYTDIWYTFVSLALGYYLNCSILPQLQRMTAIGGTARSQPNNMCLYKKRLRHTHSEGESLIRCIPTAYTYCCMHIMRYAYCCCTCVQCLRVTINRQGLPCGRNPM